MEPKLKEYTVVWVIDVVAENEVGAAYAARAIMNDSNDPDCIDNSFGVRKMGRIDFPEDMVWVDIDVLEGRV